MAHHSSEMSDAMRRQFEEMFPSIGATGRFPQGHLSPEDEGELAIAVGVMDGKIILNFGKPVLWIGFTPRQAMEIAELINKKSSDLLDAEDSRYGLGCE